MELTRLPGEMLENIYPYLPTKDLISFSQTSKKGKYTTSRELNKRRWGRALKEAGLFFVDLVKQSPDGLIITRIIQIDDFFDNQLEYLFGYEKNNLLNTFKDYIKNPNNYTHFEITLSNFFDDNKIIFYATIGKNNQEDIIIENEIKNYSDCIEVIALLMYNNIEIESYS